MRNRLIGLVVAANLGCAAQTGPAVQVPVAGAAPGTGVALAIADIPEELGTFRLSETHRYPDPSAGTLYRFRNNSELRPDVYVYPVAAPPGGAPLNPAREEGMNFGRVLTSQQRQRRFDSFEILEHGPLEHTVGSSVIPGWHSYAVLTRRGEKSDSHLHLFVIGDQMLKIRATYPQGSVQTAELDEFISALVRDITRAEPSGAGTLRPGSAQRP